MSLVLNVRRHCVCVLLGVGGAAVITDCRPFLHPTNGHKVLPLLTNLHFVVCTITDCSTNESVLAC